MACALTTLESHRQHVDSPVVYVPSVDCSLTMARYLALHGGGGKRAHRKSLLPRRCLPSELRDHSDDKGAKTRVGLKRKREQQLEELKPVECDDAADLDHLAEASRKACEEQPSWKSLAKTLRDNANSKRRLVRLRFQSIFSFHSSLLK